MQGKIENLSTKDGEYGPSTAITINGQLYFANGRFHTAVSRMKVGDDITFEAEQKGKYWKLTSVGGSATSPGAPATAAPMRTPFAAKNPMEFNAMMATRYALDAMLGSAAQSPKEAAKLVRDLFNETVDASKDGASMEGKPAGATA